MRPVVLSGVYFIIWFLTLFCLFPMKLGSPVDPNTGAPVRPRIGFKFMIATIVASVGLAVFYGFILAGLIDV